MQPAARLGSRARPATLPWPTLPWPSLTINLTCIVQACQLLVDTHEERGDKVGRRFFRGFRTAGSLHP